MSVAQLEKAHAALQKKDFGKALSLLLTAWRDEPGVVLADLIDAVSRRAGEGLPSLVKKPLAAQREGWLAVEKKKNPVDFERLVAVPMSRKWLEVADLLNPLQSRPKDPRLARFLRELLEAKTMYEIRSDKMYGGLESYVYALQWDLVQLGDARQVDFLLTATKKNPNRGAYAHRSGPSTRELALELQKAPQPKGRSLELAKSMLVSFGSPSTSPGDAKALLAQIYERPDDLSLRAVYADALTSSGDVRGEFISLQLSGKRTAREAKLIKTNLRGWAGPLDPLFKQDDRHFENGFFAGGDLELEAPKKKDLTHREWRLVTQLRLVGTYQEPEASFLERMPMLRSLEFFDEKHLKYLLGREWPFTTLKFRVADDELNLAEKVTAKVFPKLTRLIVHHPKPDRLFAWLARTPLFGQLASLRAEGMATPGKAWWKRFNDTTLTSFELESRGWSMQFTRDERGALSKLKVEPIWGSKTQAELLREVLVTGPVKPSVVEFVPNRRAKHLSARDVG